MFGINLGERPWFDWSQISLSLSFCLLFSFCLLLDLSIILSTSPIHTFFLFHPVESVPSHRLESRPHTKHTHTHIHTQRERKRGESERFMNFMLFMPYSVQNHSKPKGSACTRHENLHKNKRRERSMDVKGGKKKKEGCSGNGSGSSDTLKLQLLSLCFQKTTGVPQSLGTAVSQILVLNDVRNKAFCRATASTQLWRPSLRLTLAMSLQAQKNGTVSHWHLSI